MCSFCDTKGKHYSDKCEINSDVNTRFENIKNTNRCYNCFGSDHEKKDCKKKMPCYISKGNHDTGSRKRKTDNEQEKHSLAVNNETYVLLQTVKVIADVKEIKEVAIKIVFYSCPQQTYITKKDAKKLNLTSIRKFKMAVKPFGKGHDEGKRI